MENLKNRTDKELIEIYDMVQVEINKMLKVIQAKSKYYVTGQFSLFADDPKNCMNVDMYIGLLERPHSVTIDKMEYYKKVNPDNVLNKPIFAHKHNSWYMIYDGVHRTAANEALEKETIKVNIIVPYPENK